MTASAALDAIERMLLTLWVGGLWITGLVFAPLLFASFARPLAGEVAGRLFSAMGLVGLFCGVLLLILLVTRSGWRSFRQWRTVTLVLMTVIALIGEFGLAAHMRELRDVAVHHPHSSELWAEFRRLHGLASALYVVNCLLGLALVVAGLRPRGVQAGS